MPATMNLSLTDELRAFVDDSCGDGTDYATPSEFLRDLIRKTKAKQEAEALRMAILEGYQDAVAGRGVVYRGNIREAIAEVKQKDKDDWK